MSDHEYYECPCGRNHPVGVECAIGKKVRCRERIRAKAQRPLIICLCGSSQYPGAFLDATEKETMAGRIVLAMAFDHTASRWRHEILRELQRHRIEMADQLYVLNVGGYIGESTRAEIEYARSLSKDIRFLEKEQLTT